MKRFVVTALVSVFVLSLASRAAASTIFIPVGTFFWTEFDAANGKFTVQNQTGAANATLDGSFPILTPLAFSGLSVDVVKGVVTTNVSLNDSGAGFQSDSTDVGLNPYPTQGTLVTGTAAGINPLSVDFDGSGPGGAVQFNLVDGTLTDSAGNKVVISGAGPGDLLNAFGILYVSAEEIGGTPRNPDPVPEPATLTLIGTGLAGAMLRRRRAARS